MSTSTTAGNTTAKATPEPKKAGRRRTRREPKPTDPSVTTPPRLRRRPLWIAVGVISIAVGALLAAWLVARVGDTNPVVAVQQDVQRGQIITAEDLMVVSVSADPALRTVPGSDLEGLTGQYAAYDLVPGTIVSPASVTDIVTPTENESVVGVALLPSQLPALPLRAGDAVRVVATPRAQDDPPSAGTASIDAIVVTSGAAAETGKVVVDLVLPSAQAAPLAALAATGRVALVIDGSAVSGTTSQAPTEDGAGQTATPPAEDSAEQTSPPPAGGEGQG